MNEPKPRAGRGVSIAIRVAGLVVASMFLAGNYNGWTALLIARNQDTGGDATLSGVDCDAVPCEWQIRIDCDGRITWLGGSAGNGTGVVIDFRPEP